MISRDWGDCSVLMDPLAAHQTQGDGGFSWMIHDQMAILA